MTASKKTIRATLNIAAIYVFALTTAVACSKFEVLKAKIGTATVTAAGPAVTPTKQTVSIDKVSTIYLGVDEEDETNHMWNLEINATHGSSKITFNVAPMLKPTVVIGRSSTSIGTMDYQAEGVCGDTMCSKFAVLLKVKDTATQTSYQVVQYWDLHLYNSGPQKELLNTGHTDVRSAFESMSGTAIGE